MRFVLLLLLRNDFAHFTKIAITPVWDLIETWGFREDLPLVFPHDPMLYLTTIMEKPHLL